MILPFDKVEIYITLDDDVFYRLNADFSKTEVNKEDILTEEYFHNHRVMVLHKLQFEYGKSHLMDKNNPNRISHEAAKTYCQMGFITNEEYHHFVA